MQRSTECLDGLNRSIAVVTHTCHKEDPKSECEQVLLQGEPKISSKECARIGTVKHVNGGFSCQKYKCIMNKVGNSNPTNWLRKKDKEIQQLFSQRNRTQLSKLDVKEAIDFTKKVECICVFNNQYPSKFYSCCVLKQKAQENLMKQAQTCLKNFNPESRICEGQ